MIAHFVTALFIFVTYGSAELFQHLIEIIIQFLLGLAQLVFCGCNPCFVVGKVLLCHLDHLIEFRWLRPAFDGAVVNDSNGILCILPFFCCHREGLRDGWVFLGNIGYGFSIDGLGIFIGEVSRSDVVGSCIGNDIRSEVVAYAKGMPYFFMSWSAISCEQVQSRFSSSSERSGSMTRLFRMRRIRRGLSLPAVRCPFFHSDVRQPCRQECCGSGMLLRQTCQGAWKRQCGRSSGCRDFSSAA